MFQVPMHLTVLHWEQLLHTLATLVCLYCMQLFQHFCQANFAEAITSKGRHISAAAGPLATSSAASRSLGC